MSLKAALKTLLISLAFINLTLVFGAKTVSAQTAPTPTPTPAPSCLQTVDGTPGLWTYAIGGGSRSRNIPLTDSLTGGDCGSRTETQYSYCVSNRDTQDGLATIWYLQGQQPDGATPGQCESHRQTVTICLDGRTLEVEIAGLGQYEGQYTEGSCPTPVPTPLDVCANIDGVQTSVPDGLHLDATGQNCVDFSKPGPPPESGGGTTSTGQVLGASTLAATGDGASKVGMLLMIIGSALTLSSLYAFKKSSL